MLEKLSAAAFEPYLQQSFRLSSQEFSLPEIEITLIKVSESTRPSQFNHPGRTPFSLEFLQPGTTILPQRLYILEHPEMGRLEIFLIPVGADQNGVYYQAVFN